MLNRLGHHSAGSLIPPQRVGVIYVVLSAFRGLEKTDELSTSELFC
jgi:hypothetical protein